MLELSHASYSQREHLMSPLECNIEGPNASKSTTGARSCRWAAKLKTEWYSRG